MRLRTTPEGDFVIDGSIDPHEETLVAQTRGITPDGLHLRDRLFAIHKGNPVAVYNELLGGKDDNERDYRVTCRPHSIVLLRADGVRQLSVFADATFGDEQDGYITGNVGTTALTLRNIHRSQDYHGTTDIAFRMKFFYYLNINLKPCTQQS